MKKTLPAAAIAAGLVGGGAVGAAVFAPSLAGASDDATIDPTVELIQDTDEPGDDVAGELPGGWVADTLDDLVADGTLTRDEADAVAEALAEARPEHVGFGHHHRRALALDEAAEVLGLEIGELRDLLVDGQSLADVAGDVGVDPQVVIDALVAEVSERLAVAVDEGRITQEEADERLAEAETRITDLVNGELEAPVGAGPRGRAFRDAPGEPPAGDTGDTEGTVDA